MYEHDLQELALDHNANRRVELALLPASFESGQNEDEQRIGSHVLFVLTLLWVVAVSNVFDGDIVRD